MSDLLQYIVNTNNTKNDSLLADILLAINNKCSCSQPIQSGYSFYGRMAVDGKNHIAEAEVSEQGAKGNYTLIDAQNPYQQSWEFHYHLYKEYNQYIAYKIQLQTFLQHS